MRAMGGLGGSQASNRPKGIGQLLTSLNVDTATEKKTERRGYFSADGTALTRTDTFTSKKADEKAAKEKQKFFKVKLGNQWRSAAVRTYMRLARANNQQECKRVAASASLQAGQLKRALGDDCEEKTEVQAVLSQMQKAVTRAKLKVRQLDEEQDMQRQSRRAEERRENAKALYLSQQRQKKAVVRQVREDGYVRESVVARYQAAEQVRQQVEGQTAPTVTAAQPVTVGLPAAPEMPVATPPVALTDAPLL